MHWEGMKLLSSGLNILKEWRMVGILKGLEGSAGVAKLSRELNAENVDRFSECLKKKSLVRETNRGYWCMARI